MICYHIHVFGVFKSQECSAENIESLLGFLLMYSHQFVAEVQRRPFQVCYRHPALLEKGGGLVGKLAGLVNSAFTPNVHVLFLCIGIRIHIYQSFNSSKYAIYINLLFSSQKYETNSNQEKSGAHTFILIKLCILVNTNVTFNQQIQLKSIKFLINNFVSYLWLFHMVTI